MDFNGRVYDLPPDFLDLFDAFLSFYHDPLGVIALSAVKVNFVSQSVRRAWRCWRACIEPKPLKVSFNQLT
jgi:hypothetical protein